jgi:hypothetical protein
MASFISPSGAGIKVFIKVNSNAEQHTKLTIKWQLIIKTYQVLILIQSVKILPDCAFVSSDADLYLNQSAIFELKDEAIETPKTPKKEIVTTAFNR